MKKIFFLMMLIIFLMTGCSSDNISEENNGTRGRTLIIGIDDEFAPMGFRDESGEIVGFDVDLAKEAAKRLNYKVEFKAIDWDNKEAEFTNGNIDLIWNGLDITPERKRYILYSKPYMDNRQILIVKKGADFTLTSEYDLEGKIVGTQAGSNSEDYVNADEVLKNSLRDFKTYHSYLNAFNALDDGELDVLIVDEIVGRYEMSKRPGTFEAAEITFGSVTEIAVGFRKYDTELRDKVQEAFDSMIKDGTARKISEKWFHADLIKLLK